MKHLKVYEKFESEFKIDLISILEYTGNMYDAVEFIFNLIKKARTYNFTYKNINYGNFKIRHLNRKGVDVIFFNNTSISYNFLMKHPEYNLHFTFYDMTLDNTELAIVRAKQYNL